MGHAHGLRGDDFMYFFVTRFMHRVNQRNQRLRLRAGAGRPVRNAELRGGTDPLFDPFLLPHFRPSREQEFCVQAA